MEPLLVIEGNHLLDLLSRKRRQRVLSLAEPVTLAQSEVLAEAGELTHHVYFPVDGFISLVTSIDGKPVLEVGMVGREGMLGAQISLGVPTQPLHALVQGSGSAWRIERRVFHRECGESAPLRKVLDRYVYVLMAQLAASAACTRFHHINPRLGRWLLMMQDRARLETFSVTQEFLSYMLGVRRVGITAAAGELQRQGLIEYSRGRVTVCDRSGLEGAACSCYASDRAIYGRVMGYERAHAPAARASSGSAVST